MVGFEVDVVRSEVTSGTATLDTNPQYILGLLSLPTSLNNALYRGRPSVASRVHLSPPSKAVWKVLGYTYRHLTTSPPGQTHPLSLHSTNETKRRVYVTPTRTKTDTMDLSSPLIIHTSLESESPPESSTTIPLPHLSRLQPTKLPNSSSSNLTQPNQYLTPTSPSFPTFPSNQLTPSSQQSTPSLLAHTRTPSPSYSQSTRESRMGSPYTPARNGEGGSGQGSTTKVRRESVGDGEDLSYVQEPETVSKLSFDPGFLTIPTSTSPTHVSPASAGTLDTADDRNAYEFPPNAKRTLVSNAENGLNDGKIPGDQVLPRLAVQSPARTYSSGSTVLSDDSEKTIIPGTATGLRNALSNGTASWAKTSPRSGSASHPVDSLSSGSTSTSPRRRHRPLPLNLSRKSSPAPGDEFDQAMISPSPISGRGSWRAGSGRKTAFLGDKTKDQSEPGTAVSFGSSDAGGYLG